MLRTSVRRFSSRVAVPNVNWCVALCRTPLLAFARRLTASCGPRRDAYTAKATTAEAKRAVAALRNRLNEAVVRFLFVLGFDLGLVLWGHAEVLLLCFCVMRAEPARQVGARA